MHSRDRLAAHHARGEHVAADAALLARAVEDLEAAQPVHLGDDETDSRGAYLDDRDDSRLRFAGGRGRGSRIPCGFAQCAASAASRASAGGAGRHREVAELREQDFGGAGEAGHEVVLHRGDRALEEFLAEARDDAAAHDDGLGVEEMHEVGETYAEPGGGAVHRLLDALVARPRWIRRGPSSGTCGGRSPRGRTGAGALPVADWATASLAMAVREARASRQP